VHLENPTLPGSSVARKMPSADARLVELVRRGDVEAGRRLVHAYYLGVYRYLFYLTGIRSGRRTSRRMCAGIDGITSHSRAPCRRSSSAIRCFSFRSA